MADVEQARLPPRIRLVVQRCMKALVDGYGPEYDPEDDGWVILVDRNTTDQHALELFGVPWHELRLEGVSYDQESGCYLTCWLANNQFGYSIIVPDLPWLDPTPSREDMEITRRIKEAGELLGVKLLDHIIIGDGTYVSLADRGVLQ